MWLTSKLFDDKLLEMAKAKGVGWLFSLPGVYEIVSEELNNDVLEALEKERQEEGAE